MASQSVFSTDETYFSGTIKDTQIAFETEKDEFVNSTVVSVGQGNKKQRGKKSLTADKPTTRNSRKSSSNKENAGEKKRGRPSKEAQREVLKVLNRNSPAKILAAKPKPSPRKAAVKAEPSPRKSNATEYKRTTPKIVIYRDASCQAVSPTGRLRQKVERQESRSWNGRSGGEKKSPKPSMRTRSKSTHQSLNSVTNLQSPKEKKEKEVKPSKGTTGKSPSGRGRLSKVDPEMESLLTKLESVFPNVDPEYLRTLLVKFKGSVPEMIDYIILKEKVNELPTKADYVKRQETERQQKEYLEKFSVENFLKMFPDPWEYFLKQKQENCEKYKEHSLHYLKNKFKKHYTQVIQTTLIKTGYSLYRANKQLQKNSRGMKMRATNRSKAECDSGKPTTYNEQFIHEMAFIENEAKIKAYIKKTETEKHKKFKQAKKAGTLLECLSCNDPSLLFDDAVNCPANHVFCKACVVRSVEVEVKKNNFRFKCLINCKEVFSMESLQILLPSETIGKIQILSQQEEVKAAGIKDLISCPFCFYATIMPPEVSVLNCLNPDCLKESCRHCRQLNHIPLKCNELEKFDKTILQEENQEEDGKELEDLPLICIHCNTEFLETRESKKLVCPCGATICSICRQPIPECPHFKGEPANRGPKEVLSTSNSSEVTDAKDSTPSKVFDFEENLADFYPVGFHSL